ncbi:MAG: hypothetical protein ABI693_20020 [Bryobacteraceae bacterium]
MDKQHAHQLLDRLDRGQLEAIGHLLEVMVDPVVRAIAAAPINDEPVTEDDRRRFQEGKAWLAKRGGKGIPMQEVLAQNGIASDDLR